ncbi:MAG: hypothetical protein PUP93_10365 [Rhizonema sp. NSF051]|nr:hypothetical protein [Rhizonema sp. NSF051]
MDYATGIGGKVANMTVIAPTVTPTALFNIGDVVFYQIDGIDEPGIVISSNYNQTAAVWEYKIEFGEGEVNIPETEITYYQRNGGILRDEQM